MHDDPRVQDLLDRLSDGDATPEEVCESCVELLPVVRQRWQQICRAREELDALFPPGDGSRWNSPHSASLPTVPGYEIERELGHGGMGVVYRARHLRLNRVVALKMALGGGPQDRERFRREAEAAATLRHSNAVQVHDVGDVDGRPYFTMEYLEGGNLSQRLKDRPLSIREAAELLAALTNAVEAAHKAGIIHRDLKPANVMLTPDGTPKVADFGLARRLDGEVGLTRTGATVGTPSYMAPEQAGEAKSVVGPPADIYSLGAILYESLTGQPPFRGENAAVTIYLATTQEPVPPSRLNQKVPRDLETICLTCLRKEPRRRYVSASALGDDIRRFLDGEAIAARPEGPLARLARRMRQRPLLSFAIVIAVLTTGGLLASVAWTIAERRANARAAAADLEAAEKAACADLDELDAALRKTSWASAKASLERAKGRIENRDLSQLQVRLDRGRRELELVSRLDAIRIDGFSMVAEGIDFRRSDQEYREAFERAQILSSWAEAPSAAAERIAASPIGPVVVAALDHWASCRLSDPSQKAWLIETARLADPAGAAWRAKASNPATWRDEAAISSLIDSAPAMYPSLSLILALELKLPTFDIDPVSVLRRVQQAYPGDFWANLRLARALIVQDPREAVRYYQAALAVRPTAAVVMNDFAFALEKSGRFDEAVAMYRRAVQHHSEFSMAETNLAIILSRLGRHEEALQEVDAAFAKNVKTAGLFIALGHSLQALKRASEAQEAFREAIALEPENISALDAFRHLLLRMGKTEEAREAWARAVATSPPQYEAWYGYAEFCLFLGHEDEYRRARVALLGKFGATADPAIAERTARAALLRPAAGEELERAVSLAMMAASVDRKKLSWEYPYYQFVRGLAQYRQGKFEQAISTLRGDASRRPGPTPQLVLAMALYRNGQDAEARNVLKEALSKYDWRVDQIKDQDGWIAHILRREAETLISQR